MNISVVIPLFNEQESLPELHDWIKRVMDENKYSYEILRDYGNMSSCTVLFVLNEIMKNTSESDKNKNILSCAFGPGLTLESMVLRVC